MIEVRAITAADVTRLVKFCRQAHAESAWSWVPFSPGSLRRSILLMIRREDHVALGAFEDGEPVGFLFGTVGQVIYGNTIYATDLEFVARKGGKQLLAAFKDWAMKRGASVRIHGTSNPEETEHRDRAKDRWFQMQGLQKTGGMYCERLR